ncbi:hypothetical protein [Mycoplasmopsis columbina]|uniref:Lipoprotein n=1 Tax=Mycoplasmopsis columbina SF7 TaxID=1037410 RepID=F9UJN0_9BACT|nr:hypothetical protein [Mycoplasmopsis columbina]EGV00411.1 hypothetical protein MCSF7_00381 [Mycoplasmopsis columbina SF7]VEU76724.1 Uncharacterised protein [Mycoplasmopsis columbina]
MKTCSSIISILTVIPVAVACASKEEKEAQYEKEYKATVRNNDSAKADAIFDKLSELYGDPFIALEITSKWDNEL